MLKTTRLPNGRILDPPDLAKYAARVDPPMERWPGRPLGREDIASACGDPRDCSSLVTANLRQRSRGRNSPTLRLGANRYSPGFSWNQVLINWGVRGREDRLGHVHCPSFLRPWPSRVFKRRAFVRLARVANRHLHDVESITPLRRHCRLTSRRRRSVAGCRRESPSTASSRTT